MSADNDAHNPEKQQPGQLEAPAHHTQAEIDDEIAAIQQKSRHQQATVQRPPEVPPAPPSKALLLVGIFLLILLVAGGLTLWDHVVHDRALAKETERDLVPTVAIIHPAQEKSDEDLVLPGSLQAYEESPIFARTNGYLVRWYKDIGSRITKGELLANIDTPEVDQELNQARAARQQIIAQLDLAKVSAQRWENLLKSDSVSAQEADQQTSGYKQAQANLAAADANVRRLEELEGFKNVYAPFSGVLTRRNVDPGALINAGAGGKEMFDVARVDPLRVYTNVPQAYSPSIKAGGVAYITLQEFPGKKFAGRIARTAESIDPTTRTLLTEVDVPNKGEQLLPGSFGEVHFAVGTGVKRVTIPVNAMLFRSQGPQAAIIGADNHVHLTSIVIGRDYGATIEILGGVNPDDQVVINPPDSLEDGELVHLAPQQQQSQPQQQPQQKGGQS